MDFRWNGYAVRVGLTAPSQPATPPMARCQASAWEGVTCVAAPDGSAQLTHLCTGPAEDGGVTVQFAWLFTTDGWDVLVTAANAADTKDSVVLAEAPPFTGEQLLPGGPQQPLAHIESNRLPTVTVLVS